MNRRSLFGALVALPLALVAGRASALPVPRNAPRPTPRPAPADPISAPFGWYERRVSSVSGDPGELNLGILRAEGWWVRVYLDGVEQADADIADPTIGYLRRVRRSPGGFIVLNGAGDEIMHEHCWGRVEVVPLPMSGVARTRRAGVDRAHQVVL